MVMRFHHSSQCISWNSVVKRAVPPVIYLPAHFFTVVWAHGYYYYLFVALIVLDLAWESL